MLSRVHDGALSELTLWYHMDPILDTSFVQFCIIGSLAPLSVSVSLFFALSKEISSILPLDFRFYEN